MNADPLRRALEALKSTNENERLDAARTVSQLMSELTPEIDGAVREALARETVPWIRGALAEVLASDVGAVLREGVVVPAPSWDERLDGLEADVARQVINISTRRVLHEVAAVVGRAKLAARSELRDAYTESTTARELVFLTDVCEGLRRLATATQVPQRTEFDLGEELDDVATFAEAEWICPVRAAGPKPFIVFTDRTLLRVAVQNVVANAIEAAVAVGPVEESRAVVLTWGASPGGSHVTVIDRGPGPPAFLAEVHNAGFSTKAGHPGYGLATASEAMKSLDGTVEIRRNDRGGATVVLTWKDVAQ